MRQMREKHERRNALTRPVSAMCAAHGDRRHHLATAASIAILSLLTWWPLTPASAQQPPVDLFTAAPSSAPAPLAGALGIQPKKKGPWVLNQRSVSLIPAALEQLASRTSTERTEVRMDLTSTGLVTAELRTQQQPEKAGGPHRRVWSGKLRGHQDSDVMLVTHQRTLAGSIRKGRTLYELKPASDGSYDLVEIDVDALPSDHHPIPVSREELAAAETASGTPAPPTSPAVAADVGSTIDVMVVYTTAAKNANGGQSGIEALIDLGISLANTAFTNSQINTQFRLVHAAEVSYAESGDYNTDLTRLRSTTDGFMDEVHGWRNTHKADLVALIEDNLGGACGVAYVMTNVSTSFAGWAFSVTQDSCVSSYTLAHELGHNMGSQHDRAEGGTGAYPYSFGHKEPGKFRTIMAYPCSPGCSRINHFSNPNVLYQGTWATGVDHNVDTANSADNARAFGNALNTIANFRNSGDTTPPPAPTNLRILP